MLDYNTTKKITYEAVRELVIAYCHGEYSDSVPTSRTAIRKDDSHRIYTIKESKLYRVGNTKGITTATGHCYPFGYHSPDFPPIPKLDSREIGKFTDFIYYLIKKTSNFQFHVIN